MNQKTSDARSALVKLLIRLNQLSEKALDAPFLKSERHPVAFFAKRGDLQEERAIAALSAELRLPIVTEEECRRANVGEVLRHPRLSAMKLDEWREMGFAPLEIDRENLRVALVNPLDISSQQRLQFELSVTLEPRLAGEETVLALLSRAELNGDGYSLRKIVESTGSAAEISRSADESPSVESVDVEAPPVIQLVNRLFLEAIRARASDLHLTPSADELLVRVRVDGIMRPLFSVPRPLQAATVSRIKLLAGMDIAERRRPQDGRFRLKTTPGTFDVRVSTVPTPHGENIVGRLLQSDVGVVNFDDLGMVPALENRFIEALKASSRIILVTGPTGSGKSSTVYAALLKLHDGTRNIVTIEDPIEYRLPGVTQIQVNAKTGLTFAAALRSVLRQDPDVIMVGEIRDAETAQLAVQAAQTGHLILSTLHTDSAPSAITRLQDLGVPGYAIAASLGSVLAQRLVRKLCNACAAAESEEVAAKFLARGFPSGSYRASIGCDACQGEGYTGRIGVFSLLSIDGALQEAIRDEASEQEIVKLASEHGFEQLSQSARALIASGATTEDAVEEVLGPLGDAMHNWSATRSGVKPEGGVPVLHKRKILLIEDDEDTRHVMRLILEREFYDVIEAENGRVGLSKLYEILPDAVICDLMMPEMDGREFLRRLQQDSRTNHIPVLMLTAAATEENELNSIGGGASDFVAKGSDSRILLARLERLLPE